MRVNDLGKANQTTRLITRIRSRMTARPSSIAFYLVVEVADIWMIRRMLLNVRDRAERTASPWIRYACEGEPSADRQGVFTNHRSASVQAA